ncbi:MAG TPA: thiamine pyrophosphate-binding protein [Thermomicrobiales bacterium]|nr:thiamine pyrophosphate-binding protein [Thermomicrobiales bacterium]
MARLNGWQALVRGLEREGVPAVFGLPGSPKHLYDALYDSSSVRAVLVRHETSGTYMAMAWARIRNEIAACFGCPGPGVANMVPGVLEAYSGCTPMLVLGVRAPTRTNGMGAFQEADHLSMMAGITKWAATIERTDRTDWYLRRAISIATTGQPGPVYLEFPGDLALEEAEFGEYAPAVRGLRPAPDPGAIARAADLIAAARRPLIVCGGGSVLSGAGPALTALIDSFGIPVQTTPAGRGVIGERHALYCGMVGLYRTTFPRELYEEADLLITVGSRMEEFQSANFTYFPVGAKLIQIDIEPFEIGRNWAPDVGIQSDAALALHALHAALAERGARADDERVASIMERRADAIENARVDAMQDGTPAKGKRIVSEINRVFGDNTILVKENGGQDLWAYYWPYYQSFDAGCVVPPAEQTVMGYGVVGAIAAKMAAPERQVVSTSGDGAFQMAMHEIATAVQERAPVTWVVMNDGALGWPRWTQAGALNGRFIATEFDPVFDFVAVARAAGCDGHRVEDVSELAASLERARQANADGTPFVVDVPVDPTDHHEEFYAFHNVR